MGRYYTSGSGNFDGKFWFGVQPSDDPETVFGMREVDTDGSSYSDYETTDRRKVRSAIHKQFDILGVPKEKRELKFNHGNDIGAYVWDELQDYFLTKDKENCVDEVPYSVGNDGGVAYPISREKELAAARLSLGLKILNEMNYDSKGVAFFNAEW